MQNMIGELAKSGLADVNVEQLKKELLRHQKPLAFQIDALVAQLEYQKSLIPQHVVDPLIESVKNHLIKQLDKLKCS